MWSSLPYMPCTTTNEALRASSSVTIVKNNCWVKQYNTYRHPSVPPDLHSRSSCPVLSWYRGHEEINSQQPSSMSLTSCREPCIRCSRLNRQSTTRVCAHLFGDHRRFQHALIKIRRIVRPQWILHPKYSHIRTGHLHQSLPSTLHTPDRWPGAILCSSHLTEEFIRIRCSWLWGDSPSGHLQQWHWRASRAVHRASSTRSRPWTPFNKPASMLLLALHALKDQTRTRFRSSRNCWRDSGALIT